MAREWSPYDPAWLVSLATEQMPNAPWLQDALARCTRCCVESDAYIHFVDPQDANEPNAEWQFAECIILVDAARGDLVLDILKDRRVGGVEFSTKLL